MIKENHRLSQAAVDDIVQLVQTVYNDVSTSAVRHHGEESGVDMSSDFFQQLSEILEQLKSPIESVKTAYKQQSYITKNLPLVSVIIIKWVYYKLFCGSFRRYFVGVSMVA